MILINSVIILSTIIKKKPVMQVRTVAFKTPHKAGKILEKGSIKNALENIFLMIPESCL